MRFDEARTHFFRMHYRWARSFLLAEIKNGFPNLGCVDSRAALDYLAFMNRLPSAERERFALAIQKCSFRDLLEGTPDQVSKSDKLCIAEYEQFAIKSRTVEQILNPGRYCPWGKLDRKLLRKSLKKELGEIRGLEFEDLGGGGWIYYKKVGDLLVSTSVGTGSSMYPLAYHHSVLVTSRYCIYEHVSILTWTGIAGSTYWDRIRPDDIETTCVNLRRLVSLFLDQTGSFIDDTSVELPAE